MLDDYARHPWRPGTRDVLASMDERTVDLWTVIDENGDVVDRARDRVINAIDHGDVDGDDPRHDAERTPRTELLSYPVARVFASVVDTDGGRRDPGHGGAIVCRALAKGEAAAAVRDLDDAFAAAGTNATTDDLAVAVSALTDIDALAEIALTDGLAVEDGHVTIDIATYLEVAPALRGAPWRLVNRCVDDGRVRLDGDELELFTTRAIACYIEADLPVTVPEVTAKRLVDHPAVDAIRDAAGDLTSYATREIDTVVPEEFPPCMKALLDAIQQGEHLTHESRFAITAFLTTIGMSTDEIVELYGVNPGFGERITRYQTDHIRNGGTDGKGYTPPSCATMVTRGDCVNRDDRCETIGHPLAYYEQALDEMDEADGGDDDA